MSGSKQNSSKSKNNYYELSPDEILVFPETNGEEKLSTINKNLVDDCAVKNPKKKKSFPIWKKIIKHYENYNWKSALPILLFTCCLAIYISTRLVGLRQYPIYFFTDEAVQTINAEDLVNKHFVGNDDVFLPTLFYNGYQYNLGTSVYLQVIPYMLFGRVIEVNRGVSALATSLSAVFLYLLARKIYKIKYPWLVILLLSITPVWFMHSRTAFETSLAFMFYSGFMYYYFSYRKGERKHIYMAVVMAALTFYSYSPAQFVILISGGVFFLIDWRYHFEKPKQIGLAFALALILSIPMIRFQIQHPGANLEHMAVLRSYWLDNISIFEKLKLFFREYFSSLSPYFWFFYNTATLIRHRMGHYALIPVTYLPFIVIALILVIKNWKEAAYRDLLLVLLIAPIGGSTVGRGVTRILITVIPFVMMTMIGINWLQGQIEKRKQLINKIITIGLGVILCGFNFYLLLDALNNGATWDSDYGMSGLQYGGVQLAEKLPEYLNDKEDPQKLLVSPTWANGTDIIMRFFFGTPLPFDMGNIDAYLTNYVPIPDDLLFVMTMPEYNDMIKSGKFDQIQIIDEIPYPNGEPGFLFVKLQYAENIEEIFANEAAARRILQEGEVDVSGVPAEVSYSYLDMGQLSDIFDNDTDTIARTFEANPMEVNVHYLVPVNLQQCTARIGGTPSHVELALYDEDQQLISEYALDAEKTMTPRVVDFQIDPVNNVSYANLSVENAGEGEPSHVHLWEFTCTPQGE
jgi:hypothetical protein